MRLIIYTSKFSAFRRRGFALVITLVLMILLTVLAVALRTLPGVSLRSDQQNGALAVFRNSARFGLMSALGEIQKEFVPGQMINAVTGISTPGAYGMKTVIPEYPANTETSSKVITLAGLELAAPAADRPKRWFHGFDHTCFSINPATAGWCCTASPNGSPIPGRTGAAHNS